MRSGGEAARVLVWLTSSAPSGETKWTSHRSHPSHPPAVGITSTQRSKRVGQVEHHIMLPFHQSCLGPLHLHTAQGTAMTPRPHTHPYATMGRPITQVQRMPRGPCREVFSASKGCPDCGLAGTSKALPSCQWDTSSPWLHFLSASPQVQGREANSQAISIFNADQGCVGAARWDIHSGSAQQAGGVGETHQPPVSRQR